MKFFLSVDEKIVILTICFFCFGKKNRSPTNVTLNSADFGESDNVAASIYVPIHAQYEPRRGADVQQWIIRVKYYYNGGSKGPAAAVKDTLLNQGQVPLRGQKLDLSISVPWEPMSGNFEVILIAAGYDELHLPMFAVLVELPCVRCGELFHVGVAEFTLPPPVSSPTDVFGVTSEPTLKRRRFARSVTAHSGTCQWRFRLAQYRRQQSKKNQG